MKCDICSQDICNSFILKRHKATVHGVKPSDAISCDYCPMFFEIEGVYHKHMAKHHPEMTMKTLNQTWKNSFSFEKSEVVCALKLLPKAIEDGAGVAKKWIGVCFLDKTWSDMLVGLNLKDWMGVLEDFKDCCCGVGLSQWDKLE